VFFFPTSCSSPMASSLFCGPMGPSIPPWGQEPLWRAAFGTGFNVPWRPVIRAVAKTKRESWKIDEKDGEKMSLVSTWFHTFRLGVPILVEGIEECPPWTQRLLYLQKNFAHCAWDMVWSENGICIPNCP
jgi:hypothetical protein